MNTKIKIIIASTSGIISLVYFLGPLLSFIDVIGNYFDWTLDYDIFILSAGIFGGTTFYLTGTMWPHVIQIILFLLGWLITYKIFAFLFKALILKKF